MGLRSILNAMVSPLGYECLRKQADPGDAYDSDGLWSIHDHTFMQDPVFQAAYARGTASLTRDGTPAKDSYRWFWRVHIGLWAASVAAKLPGDFVECGVNYGFMSSAIMQLLNWNSLNKTFHLLDTFAGIDENQLTESEKRADRAEANKKNLDSGHYVRGADRARANFAEWPRAHIIVGSVPASLAEIPPGPLAFLHLDMNCAAPEIAAAEYLWDRLAPGAPILMDDFAYQGYPEQNATLKAFAQRKKVSIAALPTGQGLMLKPPAS